MRKILSAALILMLPLSGCSSIRDSNANPFNWFGGDDEVAAPQTAPEEVNPLIPQGTGLFQSSREERARYKGTPIAAVTDLTVEPLPDGVLIRATGLAATQGVYEARLTPDTGDETPVDGVLTYRLEARNNDANAIQGAPRTREVTVARTLTNQELGETRVIRVEGVQNALETRRR